MVDKRGQQMTLGTIIAIVLGIAVLVFLIFGFSSGWNNLWDRVSNLGGGSANLATIKQSCEIACTANEKDNWCSFERTVKFGEEKKIVDEGGSKCSDGGQGESDSCETTCDYLANNVLTDNSPLDIGVDKCPSITC